MKEYAKIVRKVVHKILNKTDLLEDDKMKKFSIILLLFLVSVVTFTLDVSTSILPYYYISKEIVGEKGNVNLIVPPGKSPHTYSLTPKELIPIYDSDVLIINGIGLEVFISKLSDNLYKEGVKIVEVSNYIPKEEFIFSNHSHEEDYEHETGHKDDEVFGYDPHIWLDPYLMYNYVIPSLTEEFSKLDPTSKGFYEQNAQNLINRLKLLDEYLKEKAKTISGSIFTVHNAFEYFAKRYDIPIIGVLQISPGVDPTPKQIIELAELANKENVKAIFNEPQLSDRAVNTLAKSLNLRTGVLDPLGSNDNIIDLESLYLYNLYEIIRVVNYEE